MNEQQLKEAFMQYLQQKSGAQTQQEFEAYIQQLGEEGLQQEYAQFMQMMQQQQVAARKFGGMLNYIGKLRGVCPEGYEMQFFKQGGQICKKCVQKAKMEDGGKTPQNPVDAFKCGRKMKKKACGGSVEKDKCGNKMEMDKCGSKMKKKACGGNIKKAGDGTPLEKQETLTSKGTRRQTLYRDGREFLTRNIAGNDTVFTTPNGWGPANTPNNPLFKDYNKGFENLWNAPTTVDNTAYYGGTLPEVTVYGKRK